ncbi:MAG: JAB domain-containing protein, partial [Halanaerobiales bacterium]
MGDIVDINDYFDNKLIKELRDEIKKASGNEVYFVAKIDIEEKKVCSFEVRARGNRRMVPALLADLNPGQLIIHNHPSGNLDPSAPDIRLASKMGERGIGFAIINNEVNDIY